MNLTEKEVKRRFNLKRGFKCIRLQLDTLKLRTDNMDKLLIQQKAREYFLHIETVKSIYEKSDGDLKKFNKLLEVEAKI